MSDVSLIAAGQRVEHYEIAVYATLRRGRFLALAEGAVVLESVQRHRGARELSSCCVVWAGCLRFVPGPP